MTTQPRPRPRRPRPSLPPLSREGIVDAAMTVIETDGIEKLSTRRVAAELDTGPASLYVHVRNLTELKGQLIDRFLADLDVRWDPAAEDWRPRLGRVLADYEDLLVRRPGVAHAALETWPDGPHYLDLIELLLRLMIAGGVPAGQASWGVDLLLQVATASAVEWGQRGDHPDQSLTDLGATLGDAHPERHPVLASLGSAALIDGGPERRRAWFLDVLLAGILATPRTDGT